MVTDDFSGWTRFPGGSPTAPSLSASESGLVLTVKGFNNLIYYSTYDGSWSPWKAILGTTFNAPATTVVGDMYHIVVSGGDGMLYHGRMSLDSEVFIGWSWISGYTPSQPVLCDDEENLYLVVRGSDNRIYWNMFDGGWGSWLNIPGSTVQSPGAAVYDGELWVCVTGFYTRAQY